MRTWCFQQFKYVVWLHRHRKVLDYLTVCWHLTFHSFAILSYGPRITVGSIATSYIIDITLIWKGINSKPIQRNKTRLFEHFVAGSLEHAPRWMVALLMKAWVQPSTCLVWHYYDWLSNRLSASRAIFSLMYRAKSHTPNGPVTLIVSHILGDISFYLAHISSSFCGNIPAQSSLSNHCLRFACHVLVLCHLSVCSALGFGDGDEGLWHSMSVGFSLGINDCVSPT